MTMDQIDALLTADQIEVLSADIAHMDMEIALMESEGDTDHSMGYGDLPAIRDNSQDELLSLQH